MCNKEKFWHQLCLKIGAGDLLADSRFKDFPARLKHRKQLTEVLDKIFIKESTEQWMERFGVEVPASAVLSLEDALNNSFLTDNENIVDCEREANSPIRFLRNPVRYNEGVETACAPRLGEHTEELLAEIGYNDADLSQFRRDRIIL